MKDVVIFHLKRIWEGKDLWEEIKQGRKTSEWRDLSRYWLKRLVTKANVQISGISPWDLTPFLKVHRAWFVQGYPKANLPRLVADITGLVYHPSSSQLEIKFTNVQEITEETLRRQKLSVENEKVAKLLDSQRRRLAYSFHTVPKETTK